MPSKPCTIQPPIAGRLCTHLHRAPGWPLRPVRSAAGVAYDPASRGAGVARSMAMELVGHKTESVYQRYDIVAERDLPDAVQKYASRLILNLRDGGNAIGAHQKNHSAKR